MANEDQLVRWLRQRLGARADAPGDDAAFLPPGQALAVSVDQQIQGVHFVDDLDPRVVGRRLTRVCLSDLAATGARPRYGFLALAVPPGFAARRLLDGVFTECRTFDLRLAGGDLAASERVHAALTVVGDRPPQSRWVRRSGAVAGDRLWVGGSLGGSAAGRELVRRGARLSGRGATLPDEPPIQGGVAAAARRMVRLHLLPEPQLELGLWLGRRRRAAALDVSDGLALDLHRLCRESGVGAVVDDGALPRSERLEAVCAALDLSEDAAVRGGGEDYVLLFALPPSVRPPARLDCAPIGRLTAGREVMIRSGGRLRRLPASGWDHLGRLPTGRP